MAVIIGRRRKDWTGVDKERLLLEIALRGLEVGLLGRALKDLDRNPRQSFKRYAFGTVCAAVTLLVTRKSTPSALLVQSLFDLLLVC